MIGPGGYGSAELRTDADGLIEVVAADEVIGISLELLVKAVGTGLYVDVDGLLLLAGDRDYRYRPVRFVDHGVGLPTEGARVLVCERVR